ncbi:hypothetical protein Q2941_48630 [Bradyrhizobium sp. UFLA05-153]
MRKILFNRAKLISQVGIFAHASRAQRGGGPLGPSAGRLIVLFVALQVHAIDAFIDQSIQFLVPQRIPPEQPAMQVIGKQKQDYCSSREIVGPVHTQNRA